MGVQPAAFRDMGWLANREDRNLETGLPFMRAMARLGAGLLAAAIAASAAWSQDKPLVRIGTEGAYEPYNFIAENGRIDGFERELGDRLCALAAVRCEWMKNDWETIIPNLVARRYDVIMAAMSVTEERRRTLEFSQDYLPPSPSAWLGRKGATADALKGRVGVQAQTVQAAYLEGSGATPVAFPTADAAVDALRAGSVDVVLADREFLVKFAGHDNLEFVAGDVLIGGGIAAGLRREDTELRARFDAAISTLKQDGSLNAMIDKWFPGAKGF